MFYRLKAAHAYITEHLRDPKLKWRSLLWEAFGDYATNSSDLSCSSVHTSPLLYLSRLETTVCFPPYGAMGEVGPSGTKLKGSAPSVGTQNISANACIVARVVERAVCKYKASLLELVEIIGSIYTFGV